MACGLLRKKAEKPVIGPIHDKSTSWSLVELFAHYYFAIFRDSSLMQITVKTFAQTRELSKTPSLHLEIEEGETVANVTSRLKNMDSNWALALEGSVLTARNQQLCDSKTVLGANDELAYFPPVTGG